MSQENLKLRMMLLQNEKEAVELARPEWDKMALLFGHWLSAVAPIDISGEDPEVHRQVSSPAFTSRHGPDQGTYAAP